MPLSLVDPPKTVAVGGASAHDHHVMAAMHLGQAWVGHTEATKLAKSAQHELACVQAKRVADHTAQATYHVIEAIKKRARQTGTVTLRCVQTSVATRDIENP
jgi:hypothetical protein